MSDLFPSQGRLAGVDYGTVRIGVAISDPGQSLASPLENYVCRDAKRDADFFLEVAREHDLVGFIVGLPIHTSGDESQKSQEARAFGAWLSDTTKLPVRFYDERYSSAMADQYMQQGAVKKKNRKTRRDVLAAQVILAAYLESSRQTDRHDEHHGEL